MGFVYLLHFEKPISKNHTTQHYLGYTENVEERLEQHRLGNGARLCQVAAERNIGFVLARLWQDVGKGMERKLKNRKNGKMLCPICTKG